MKYSEKKVKKRAINPEELLVLKNLELQGFENIVYEPNGNSTPDFSINNTIAVEVRRLNQNIVKNKSFEGLEQDEWRIFGIVNRILVSLNSDIYDRSIFLCYKFKRPIPNNKKIESFIREVLNNSMVEIGKRNVYSLDESFFLECFYSFKKFSKQYIIGSTLDLDFGGSIIDIFRTNINLVIGEKEQKIAQKKCMYEKWWLALVDYTDIGVLEECLNEVMMVSEIDTVFDKVLLINRTDYKLFKYLK